MKSRNIKVVDEHNIDRVANIIFGFDLDGSEYVTYWIERDEESNNVFVSKIVKNLDDTFNLANIEDEFEKENVSKVVKDLISKSVSDEGDKLIGESLTLENGKIVKFISVSFNKEQRLDVKKTYITTVKKEVTKVSEKYYDVVEEEAVKAQETTQDIFPTVVEEKTTEIVEPVIPVEPVVVPDAPVLSTPSVEPVSVVSSEPVATVVESITNPIIEPVPVVETKVEEVPVVETPVTPVLPIEPVTVPEIPAAESVVPAAPVVGQSSVVLPEPVEPTPIVPVSEPVVSLPETPAVVEPVAVPVSEPQTLVFNASKETNLNAALGEAAKDATIPVENIEVVREFGEEAPASVQASPVSVPPVQTPAATILQPEVPAAPTGTTTKAGFANSKFFMVVAIAFFLASCVFLGYEVFNYFQLTK